MPISERPYIENTEDTRIAVAQSMLEGLKAQWESCHYLACIARRFTGIEVGKREAEEDYARARFEAMKWLMQKAGVPLEAQTGLEGG